MKLTNCQGFLFSAGLGTRLKPFTNSAPKALFPLNNIPLLQRNIEYFKTFGIQSIVINTHHYANQIEDFLKANNNFNIDIHISFEEELLETGGGLKFALPLLNSENILALNSDILTNLNINKLWEKHQDFGADASLAVTDRESSRKLYFNTADRLVGWKNFNTQEQIGESNGQAYAFSGMHILKKKFIESWEEEGKFSIIKPYMDYMKSSKIICYNHTGDKIIDVGKPHAVEKAEKLFA